FSVDPLRPLAFLALSRTDGHRVSPARTLQSIRRESVSAFSFAFPLAGEPRRDSEVLQYGKSNFLGPLSRAHFARVPAFDPASRVRAPGRCHHVLDGALSLVVKARDLVHDDLSRHILALGCA